MAVDLNGYENTLKENRPILSVEEFNNYLSTTQRPFLDSILYYLTFKIISKDNFNFEKYYEEFDISSKEEFYELLLQEINADGQITNPEDLIKYVPEELINQLGDVDSKLEDVNDIEGLEEIFKTILDVDELDKLYEQRLVQSATEVSKYNLSQIPPELYSKTNFLKYINFQNTGARLDFDYIKENSNSNDIYISSKNLQGTELISFDYELYKGEGYYTYAVKTENFDFSQYQTILESYNRANKLIDQDIADFLVNEKLQRDNIWLINFAFEDLDKRILLATNIWKNLTPEVQLENQKNFEKLIEYAKKTGSLRYRTKDVLKYTHSELLEKFSTDILSLYTEKMDKLIVIIIAQFLNI